MSHILFLKKWLHASLYLRVLTCPWKVKWLCCRLFFWLKSIIWHANFRGQMAMRLLVLQELTCARSVKWGRYPHIFCSSCLCPFKKKCAMQLKESGLLMIWSHFCLKAEWMKYTSISYICLPGQVAMRHRSFTSSSLSSINVKMLFLVAVM